MVELDASTVKDKGASCTRCAKKEMELNSFLTNSKEDNVSKLILFGIFFSFVLSTKQSKAVVCPHS